MLKIKENGWHARHPIHLEHESVANERIVQLGREQLDKCRIARSRRRQWIGQYVDVGRELAILLAQAKIKRIQNGQGTAEWVSGNDNFTCIAELLQTQLKISHT